MHITIEGIFLLKLDYELFPENIPDPKDLKYGLDVSIENAISPDKKTLSQEVTFDLSYELDNPAFKLIFTFLGQYSFEEPGVPNIDEFAWINGPAYIVPYARELIANITSRITALPTLILPPINVHELIEESERRKAAHEKPEIEAEES